MATNRQIHLLHCYFTPSYFNWNYSVIFYPIGTYKILPDNFTKKFVFHFWIDTSGVILSSGEIKSEMIGHNEHLALFPQHSSTSEVAIQKWKMLFFSAWVKK